jgi:hypothetical protein
MQGKEDGTLIDAESLLTILGGENPTIVQERDQGTIPIAPRWMSTQEQRGDKRHSSIILTFSSQAAADRVKAAGYLWVLGQSCGIADYKSRIQVRQCGNCQGFKHGRTRCTLPPRCAICALDHSTDDHPCDECPDEARPKCKHAKPKCVNCNSAHRSDDPRCQVRLKLRSKLESSSAAQPAKSPPAPPAPAKRPVKPKRSSAKLVSELVDATIEQEQKISCLKTAAKEAGLNLTGVKDAHLGNILNMSQGDHEKALQMLTAIQSKSTPLVEGMDQDIPPGEDSTMT